MPFQFYCPQGHLLEGHESQMGQQSQCPLCGSMFLIPMLPQPAAAAAPRASAADPGCAGSAATAAAAACAAAATCGRDSSARAAQGGSAAGAARCSDCVPQGTHSGNAVRHGRPASPVPLLQHAVRAALRRQHRIPGGASGGQAAREEEINKLWVKWSIRAVIFVVVMFVGMILYATFIRPRLEEEPAAEQPPAHRRPAQPAPVNREPWPGWE